MTHEKTMNENTYTQRAEHTLDDVIAEGGGDPDTEVVTDVEYRNGDLEVTTKTLTTSAKERLVAKAILANGPGGVGYIEIVVGEYRLAAFEEGTDHIRIEGEAVNGDEYWAFECSKETAGVIRAAAEVEAPNASTDD